jgi:hypothetical protein
LSPKLGAAKHFVTRSEDGEADLGNANYHNIQEQFVGNYSKIEHAQKHSASYDFMEIVLVRKVVDPTATVLWEKYDIGQVSTEAPFMYPIEGIYTVLSKNGI